MPDSIQGYAMYHDALINKNFLDTYLVLCRLFLPWYSFMPVEHL